MTRKHFIAIANKLAYLAMHDKPSIFYAKLSWALEIINTCDESCGFDRSRFLVHISYKTDDRGKKLMKKYS